MKMSHASRAAVALGVLSMAGAAFADGLDVLLLPDFDTGQIVTGAFDDETKTVVDTDQRVFGADFGEADPAQPNFADEPGFRALPGDFDGQNWGFNVLDAVFRWNGNDFSEVSPFTMTINFGPSPDVVTPTTPGRTVPGFEIPIGNDGFDDHLNIFLNAPADDSADGIYLLTLNAFTTEFEASEPFWFVFNRGLSEAEHDLAIDYVNTNLVPSPGAMVLAPMLGAALMRRRR